jgi:hypothetical protein
MTNLRKAFGCCFALASLAVLPACGFLPGFGLLEDAALYYLPVDSVASRVACELQDFLLEYEAHADQYNHKWVLSNSPVSIKLSLTTDQSGYVNFTGVNVTQLGLGALQNFITATTQGKVTTPSLAAKLSGKRTRSVEVDFTVSPSDLDSTLYPNAGADKSSPPVNCTKWRQTDNPVQSLYLKEWLGNYFNTINLPAPESEIPGTADNVMKDVEIQQVELTTAFQIVADLSGGATPNVLGNGSVFILPVGGLSLDYSPDITHKVDIIMKLCNRAVDDQTCFAKAGQIKPWQLISDVQCKFYSALSPIMSGVSNPGKRQRGGQTLKCDKSLGKYTPDTGTRTKRKLGLISHAISPIHDGPRSTPEQRRDVAEVPAPAKVSEVSTFRDEPWR